MQEIPVMQGAKSGGDLHTCVKDPVERIGTILKTILQGASVEAYLRRYAPRPDTPQLEAWEAVLAGMAQVRAERKRAADLMLKRTQAFCAQARALKAAIVNDKTFETRAAYEQCGEVDVR